jgi:hypothetical protein
MNWADYAPRRRLSGLAKKLVAMDLAGVPADAALRHGILQLPLTLEQTCELAEAIVGHLRRAAAKRTRGRRRNRWPHDAADRELLAHLELTRDRELMLREIDAHAGAAAGRAKPEAKGARLRRTYQRMLAERTEAERQLTADPCVRRAAEGFPPGTLLGRS